VSDDPRDALLAVAREIVAKRGYVGLTMRTASAAAGVTEDVALRYYRNRESLFAAAMRLPVDPVSAIPALMVPGIEGMGERLVRFTLDTLRDPEARDDLISLARTGVTAGHAVTGLQEFIEIGVVDRVAGLIGVPDARMRSALITSYLLGVATMRYAVRLEPLASASDEEVIRMVAPVIQDLLDPRRPIPGSTLARSRTAATTTESSQAPTGGQRTRTFDPDPGATRAAEAARRAAQTAQAAPAKSARATAPPARSRPSTPAKAARSAPAKAAPAAKPAAPARRAPAGPAPRKSTATKAATKAVATKVTTKAATTAGTTKAATKATTSKAATKAVATKEATKVAAGKAADKTATRSTTTGKAATKASPATSAVKKVPSSASPSGPRHAQATPEPPPSAGQPS
jgi:AcrR family transcriptional regulator